MALSDKWCINCDQNAVQVAFICSLALGFIFLSVQVHTNGKPWRGLRTLALLQPLFVLHAVVYGLALLLITVSLIVYQVGEGHHDIARNGFAAAASLLLFVTIASNACVIVLLLQRSTGRSAYTRALSHGCIHTVLWFITVVGGTSVMKSGLGFSNLAVFLVLLLVYLIGWLFYFVPILVVEEYWPSCCVLTFLDPLAIYSHKVQLAFLTACFWDMALAGLWVYGHLTDESGIGVESWAAAIVISYIAVFPIHVFVLAAAWTAEMAGNNSEDGDIIQHYRVSSELFQFDFDRKIGEGGECVVYAGTRLDDGALTAGQTTVTDVAVRVIEFAEMTNDVKLMEKCPEYFQAQLEMLEEIRITIALQRCEHGCNCVVEFVGYYVDDPKYFLIYERCQCSLSSMLGIGEHDRPDVASRANCGLVCRNRNQEWLEAARDSVAVLNNTLETLNYAVAIAQSVAHMHSHINFEADQAPGEASGVVLHRDIKPSNFLVRSAASQKSPVVISDFGVSEWWREGQKESQEGTSLYHPPEIHAVSGFTEFSPKVDVFALACTLWQLLTRQDLYSEIFAQFSHSRDPIRDALDHIRELVVQGQRPDRYAQDWSAANCHEIGMLAVVKRAWTQDPDERPSAEEIYKELQAIQQKCQNMVKSKQKETLNVHSQVFANPLQESTIDTVIGY